MKVCVALEHRFVRLPDGTAWSEGPFGHEFWSRYLEVFEGVHCLARMKDVPALAGNWQRADGPGVSFAAVPHYTGAAEFARRAAHVRSMVRHAVSPGDAFVLRVPGALGTLAWQKLNALGYPYGVEVVGDPFDVFAPGAVRHPLRPFLRWYARRGLQRQCRGASAASYVTSHALQRRYPARCPTIAASSIDLLDDAFVTEPRRYAAGMRARSILFVGSLEQYYKAPDVLIGAVARNMARGMDLSLVIVGDGRCRPALEDLARQYGCAARVRFTGNLPGATAVRQQLDDADVFVLPSRTEGLPRAMLEAMARALPCIGSRVGGIPELLGDDALVNPGDQEALADRMREVLENPARMNAMSARNLGVARTYGYRILRQRRVSCYRLLRDTTESWLRHARARVAA